MADLIEVRAPATGTQFPTQCKVRRASTSGVTRSTSKLRDSCQSCALSKIKCPKEKPICSRCESRQMECQYFLTKRPGRKPDSESNPRRQSNSVFASSSSTKKASDSIAEVIDSGRAEQADSIRAAPPSAKNTSRTSGCFLPESTTPQQSSSGGANTHRTTQDPPR